VSDIHLDPFPDEARRATFAAVAGHLIPATHGMPAASSVVDGRRVAFVLGARPDLAEPLWAALRLELGDDPAIRLTALDEEPDLLAAVQFVVVAGYYTDGAVRDAIGYPGQLARPVSALEFPTYVEEGLIDHVVARGPIWRDPTGHATHGVGEPDDDETR